MREIIAQLERLQRQSRLMLLAQGVAIVVTALLAGAFLLIGLDFLFRLPMWFRVLVLLAALAALAWALVRYVAPALRFEPSLTQLALRMERLAPRLHGRLASAVEFSLAHEDEQNPLAARSVRETQSRLQGESALTLVRPWPTLRNSGAMLAAVALTVLFIMLAPAAARTGFTRLALPWNDTSWPARTGVASLMSEIISPAGIHPRGEALTLRAKVTRGAADQRVAASYRLQTGGEYTPWKTILLTHQSDGLHERLIDSNADALELSFTTSDDRTPRERIEFVPPPAIERATLTIAPPPYAIDRIAAREVDLGTGVDHRSRMREPVLIGSQVELTLELNKALPTDSGLNESRAAWMERVLGWSMNDATAETQAEIDDARDATGMPEFAVDAENDLVWHLRWRVGQSRTLEMTLRDQYGVENRDAIIFDLPARADQPPAVVLLDPANDQLVLPTARIDLHGEASDDVAVAVIALEAERKLAVPDVSAEVLESGGAAPPPQAVIWRVEHNVDSATGAVRAELLLEELEVEPGDVLFISALATDVFQLNGERHEPAGSAVRRLQIIDSIEYATQIRRQLSGVRQNAIRIETRQGELQSDVVEDSVQPGMERGQAELSQRLAEQREMIREIERDMRRNRLEDAQLDELVRQSQDLLDFAGQAANQATSLLEQRQRSASPQSNRGDAQQNDLQTGAEEAQDRGADDARPTESGAARQPGAASAADPESERNQGESPERDEAADPDVDDLLQEPAEEDREIVEAQQEVRDELADFIELLDRDEDTWVITRRLENLLKQQTDLQRHTEELSRRTMGRERQELSAEEQSELDRIVAQQEELRDAARELIENSRDRAEKLEELDPQAAQGMREAARTGQQRELDRDMQRAADQADQNQLQGAQQAQQSAQQTMQRMLENIDEAKRARTVQLARELASLMDSIDRLITVQENEIIALNRAVEGNDFTGRDRAMIRLNQNTVAVGAEARSAGQEARRIARTLDRAAESQGTAVASFRAQPLDVEAARTAEERSLELLKEARALTGQEQEKAQEEETRRRRQELMDNYRALAEREAALVSATEPLVALEQLDRRQLVEARRIGVRQEEIRKELNDLESEVAEIGESNVFQHVHDRIDAWALEVAESMNDGRVSRQAMAREQMIAASLMNIVRALEEQMTAPSEFAEGAQPGQQGEGQQQQQQQDQLLPPVTELRLLRGLQEQVYQQTRVLDEQAGLDDGLRREQLREIGGWQRDLMELGEEMINKLSNDE